MWEGDFVFPLFIAIGMVSFMSARGLLRLFGMALAVFCLIVPLLPSQMVKAATACVTEVRNGFDFDEYPQTDGKYIVGGTSRFYNGQIYLHDIANNTQRKLSNDTARDDNDPQIDEDHVVWRGTKSDSSDIYLYSLESDLTTNLSNDPTRTEYYPQIDGDYVVWSSYSNTDQITEIYLHDINTGVTRTISSVGRPDIHPIPLIEGNYVVWIEYETYDSNKFYLFDITTNTLTLFNEGEVANSTHDLQIDEERIVWVEEADTGGLDVFIYNLRTGIKSNLSNSTIEQKEPRIDGDKVAWLSWDWLTYFHSLTIHDLASGETKSITSPGPSSGWNLHLDNDYLAWQDNDKIYFYNGQDIVDVNKDIRLNSPEILLVGNKIIWGSDYLWPLNITTCDEGEPPVITDQPDEVTIPYQGKATFTIAATGEGDLSYQWYQGSSYENSEPIPGATSSSFTTDNLRVSTGLYWVRVSNQYGYTDSHMATAYINHVTSPTSFCQAQQLGIWWTYMPQSDGQYAAWGTNTDEVYIHNALTDATTLFLDPTARSVEAVDAGRMLYNTGSIVDLNTGVTIVDLSIYPYDWTILSGHYVFGQAVNSVGIYNLNTGTLTEVPIADAVYHYIQMVNNRYVLGLIGPSQYYIYDYTLDIFRTLTAMPMSMSYYTGGIQIDDNYVVWADGTVNDVQLLDLTTQVLTNLSNTPDISDFDVNIDNGKVVWWSDDYLNGDQRAYLYDIQSGVKTELSADIDHEHYTPQIEGNRVVWASVQELSEPAIDPQLHILDLETQSQKTISISSIAYDLQMNDRWVVWRGIDGVYLYDGIEVHQIVTTTTLSMERLELVGNLLLWRGAPVDRHWLDYEYWWHPFIADCRGAAPTITDQPDSLTINANETVTLVVTAIGDGSLGYQWYTGNAGDTSNPISGATSASYTTPALSANASYWVRVNGTFGSADSTTAIISVQQTLPPTEVTPSPTTETPVPTTETPVATTETPPTEVTPSPTTETPVPSTEVPPTAITVPPTATTAPTINLLANGGFEVDADGDKLPDSWKGKKTTIASADKLKCDKADKTFAYNGTCAFMFKGNPDGSTSKLLQKVSDTSVFVHGATVTLSTWIDPRSAPVGTKFAQAKIVYSDGSKSTLKLSIPAAGSYIQQADSVLLDLTGKSVKSVKVDLRYDGAKGKFFVDDVMLTIEAGVMSLPLP